MYLATEMHATEMQNDAIFLVIYNKKNKKKKQKIIAK